MGDLREARVSTYAQLKFLHRCLDEDVLPMLRYRPPVNTDLCRRTMADFKKKMIRVLIRDCHARIHKYRQMIEHHSSTCQSIFTAHELGILKAAILDSSRRHRKLRDDQLSGKFEKISPPKQPSTDGLVRWQRRRHQRPASQEEPSAQRLRRPPHRWQESSFYCSRRLLQQRLRETRDAWTAHKAEEIQGYADCNEWKNFFLTIKVAYGPPIKETTPILSSVSSTLFTKKTQILQRWDEHFQDVLNRLSTISDVAIVRLPQVETNVELGLLPSLHEAT
ncbi:hypothetical protein SprV_0301233400 [Sparganum proliferum]